MADDLVNDGVNFVMGSVSQARYEAEHAPPENGPGESDAQSVEFDPSEHTVSGVQEHIEANSNQIDDVLAAEKAGKNRVTLVEWLQDQKTPAGARAEDTTESEEN